MKRHLAGLLITILAYSAAAGKERKDPWTEWFQRAADQMDLRAYGSTAFHMEVKFHAFPGIVFSKKESDQVISGDGTYEETWIGPTKWRREVTFGSYHAVEAESEAGRKMQASTDYEPCRVLMLLEALLYPVPRELYSPSLAEEHDWWKIEKGALGTQSYVKISTTFGDAKAPRAYLFLPNGELLQSIELDLVTDWTSPRTFGGRLVPQHIRIQGGTRDLLTAEVTIEPAGARDGPAFELPGREAEAGMTLRPLHKYEVRGWKVGEGFRYMVGPEGRIHATVREIADRQGALREVELIYSANPEIAGTILSQVRGTTFRPMTIDKSPCEFVLTYPF